MHRLHLGTFGLRSGYAGMVDPVGLPSYLQCYEHRLERLLNRPIQTQPCHNKCCDWNQLSKSNANKFHKTAGTPYPQSCSNDNPHIFPANRTCRESHIIPIKQTFAKMSSGTNAGLHEYSNGTWSSQATLKYYLSSIGVNVKVQDKVCKAGVSLKKNEDVSEKDYLPEIWQPPLCNYFNISLWVETTMHLLGHGVTGSILDLTETVLREYKL